MKFNTKEERKEIKYTKKKETNRGSPFLNVTDLSRNLGICPEMLKKGGTMPRQGVGEASAAYGRGCPLDSATFLLLYSPTPVCEWLVPKGSLMNWSVTTAVVMPVIRRHSAIQLTWPLCMSASRFNQKKTSKSMKTSMDPKSFGWVEIVNMEGLESERSGFVCICISLSFSLCCLLAGGRLVNLIKGHHHSNNSIPLGHCCEN